MRIAAGAVVAIGLAVVGTFGLAEPARAECPYFPVPPATDAARSAREVIVGTVVENVGDQLYDFRLRVDHVLRGPAQVGDVRRFDFLFPNWPITEASEGEAIAPCEAIPGWTGNVIALSLDAVAPDGRTRYHGASWIDGTPLHRDDVPRTTLAEIEAIAGMPPTDTAPDVESARRARSGDGPPLALVGGLASVLVLLVLRRRWSEPPA